MLYESPREEDLSGIHFDLAGRISAKALGDRLSLSADCYFCGPKGFMVTVDRTLAETGVPTARRNYKVFGPAISLEPIPV